MPLAPRKARWRRSAPRSARPSEPRGASQQAAKPGGSPASVLLGARREAEAARETAHPALGNAKPVDQAEAELEKLKRETGAKRNAQLPRRKRPWMASSANISVLLDQGNGEERLRWLQRTKAPTQSLAWRSGFQASRASLPKPRPAGQDRGPAHKILNEVARRKPPAKPPPISSLRPRTPCARRTSRCARRNPA